MSLRLKKIVLWLFGRLFKARDISPSRNLKQLSMWKSLRRAGNVDSNPDGFVHEITRFALASPDERSRIEGLTLLDGVMWPTASCILHLFHRKPYPILDFRALWSLGIGVPPPCEYGFWSQYVNFTRRIATRANLDMRILDRALWQFSKENQPPRQTVKAKLV